MNPQILQNGVAQRYRTSIIMVIKRTPKSTLSGIDDQPTLSKGKTSFICQSPQISTLSNVMTSALHAMVMINLHHIFSGKVELGDLLGNLLLNK